jgi:hypothetical protein
MDHSKNIWHTLLKLKNLPFGSVLCIHDEEKNLETIDIIKKVSSDRCLEDQSIQEKFLEKYLEWIKTSSLNSFVGLDEFSFSSFSNGTTESFDKFYLKHKNRRLRYFKGEYMYHLAAAASYFDSSCFIEDSPLDKNDVVIFSLPFSDTGNAHVSMIEVLDECEKLKIPVLIDCCYFGVCGNIKFDFSYKCIENVTFSLSKNFPIQHLRVGMRLSRVDDDDTLFVYNKNKYTNRLGAAVGLEFIRRYSPDYNYETYRSVQEKFSSELGVEPSNSVFFGISKDKFVEYNRGGNSNRLCFSKYLKSGKLP